MATALVFAPAAVAARGNVTLASTSDIGAKGNSTSCCPSVSADGTKVAFVSFATNLDPVDADANILDVYVKDFTTGDITLASTSDTGVKGNDPSGINGPSLSADGTKVAFESEATNLDPADTDTIVDVYVKDLTTGDITLASTSDTGVKASDDSGDPSLSADGTKVAFSSGAANLDPAHVLGSIDVYVKDLTTGDIALASTSDTGLDGNNLSAAPSLSADGNSVAFYSRATNLDPADTNTDDDAYVKNLSTGDIVLASTSDTGVKGNGSSIWPSLPADGNRVAFSSNATNLDPADTDTLADMYVKDLVTGDIVLASTSDTGVKGNAKSDQPPSLSADGTKVAFSSNATNLDPVDTGQPSDIYLKDLTTGDIALASTSDIGVEGNAGSNGASLSGDGTMVAFASVATNLDPADTDTISDVYVKAIASITITPVSGPKKTPVAVDGAGFVPGEEVAVKYKTGLASPKTVSLCNATATANGAVSCSGVIPGAGTQGARGAHIIVAKGATSFIKVKTIFTLT
jgi:Tol biopolymer transport system component